MSPHAIGLLIGGIVPAICFGISGVFAKASTNAGISPTVYLIVGGLAITATGVFFLGIQPWKYESSSALVYAALMGTVWALGAGSVAFALMRYTVPVSQLVPLYNMNTLIAVVLSLWVFAEWKDVNMFKLLAGTVLIVVGGILVSRA